FASERDFVELAKKVPSHLIEKGELFKAGKDESGKDVFFASERDFVANRAQVAELKTVFRYQPDEQEINDFKENQGEEIEVSEQDAGRIYASSVANSADGVGGELISEDKSWHPFFNKIYKNRKLAKIEMPKAEVGFAIASHYLWMAGGERIIAIRIEINNKDSETCINKDDVLCFFTGPQKWIEKKATCFSLHNKIISLVINLSGDDPPVVPYSKETHQYNFTTDLPILRITLRHQKKKQYLYGKLNKGVKGEKIPWSIKNIQLHVYVNKLKTLAVSNDFGPVDTSKPFQPFGASPVANSALVIGSNEMFQKCLCNASVSVQWQNTPNPFEDDDKCSNGNPDDKSEESSKKIVAVDCLCDGNWELGDKKHITCKNFAFKKSQIDSLNKYFRNIISGSKPDFSESEYYDTLSYHGVIRLRLCNDFGQRDYEKCLINYIKNVVSGPNDLKQPPVPPSGPFITEISLDYTAKQAIKLDGENADKGAFKKRSAHFFHIAPFGQAEQHPFLKLEQEVEPEIFLLPQLALPKKKDDKPGVEMAVPEAAEFYIGITDLKPPQNLSLLFQVADGTANPQKDKPKPSHIDWSYLRQNEWISFPSDAVEDRTDELITSGIITFAVPRDASDDNTLLPAGKHWIRAAVSSNPDAVCRLRMVAAQALKVTFVDRENDPTFSTKVLPKNKISKLAQPAAAVKKIIQPFPSYGGRGKEESKAFYTRVSERLRHKDRAVTLWDYERLILEEFPEVHKVKCLNHTRYNKKAAKYIHNAPGHVTIVTVADRERHRFPDPLRPNVSLGLHQNIKNFLKPRLSTFVKPHIVNPTFEEVKVDFQVKFHPGFDETYAVNTLQESLVHFLSPWAFPGGGTPSFGGKIYKSVLINFVEEQPYVDYVTCFRLMHLLGKCEKEDKKDHEEVKGNSAISILVSVPIGGHKITPIDSSKEKDSLDENYNCNEAI
ncbi:MAG: hypothetical protein D3904_01420, partial [Candidatus Electrothrix sp. EH2]|nr:hypothetical protein [Candidatus Electrothrix sp. EH2]